MTDARFPPLPKDHVPTEWFRLEAKPSERTAEIILYGAIGGWFGVQAVDLVATLADLDVDTIELRVNSPGGSAYDGIAIMNALHRHKARVIATVDGLAASAASVIVQAADELVMGRGSELMIHDASNIAWGNADALRTEADHLDRLSQSVAGIYAERAGGTADEWREAMLAETWYSAQEAVDAGLADRVEGKTTDDEDDDSGATNTAAARYRTMFAHAGRAEAPAPHMPQNTHRRSRQSLSLVQGSPLRTALHLAAQATTTRPPAEPGGSTTTNQEGPDAMSDKLASGILELLGRKAEDNLTDEALLGLVEEQLTAPANTTTTTPPAGTLLVDETQYNSLVADATAGRQAREHQLAAERTAAVDAAVREGRIAPARKDHWLKALEADDGAIETLKSLAKGLVPLDAEGHTGGVDEATDEDTELYVKTFGPADSTKEG